MATGEKTMERADYANPIKPSVAGGSKIAEQIVRIVTSHDFRRPLCTIGHR